MDLFIVVVTRWITVDTIDIITEVKRVAGPWSAASGGFALTAETLKQHHRDIEASLVGFPDTGAQLIEVSLVEPTEVKLASLIERRSRTLSLIRQGIKVNLCATFIGPRCLFPRPQAHEVVIVLLEKIKIARKVQDGLVAPVNQTIVQMNAREVNGFAGRIDEKPGIAGANTQRSSGLRRC